MSNTDTMPDPAFLAEAAREALTRPPDSGWSWDGAFTTHGCVHTWADRSDDVLAESNHHAMLAALEGAQAHDDTAQARYDETEEPDVVETGARHFAWGHVMHIFVRVYTDDSHTAYTDAFIEAVRLAGAMRNYPVLDESDYSEREHKAWQETADDALDAAWRDDDRAELVEFDDREALERAFWDYVREQGGYDLLSHGECTAEYVDYDVVKAVWVEVRTAFYAAR